MSVTVPIRINKALYDQAREVALTEQRTVAGQIEFWAKVGRAALDNPDLPVSFIANSLCAMSEPKTYATLFSPRNTE